MRHNRALGYARVSSEEQALGTSLRDQQDAISAHAKACGLGRVRFFVEAESAVHEKIERREQMRALLADVRRNDLVLCHRLDRWSRDPEFTYSSVRKILAAGASFYAVDDRCDPSTPEGDTMLGFRVLFAREEHKRIKQRMVGTRRIVRDQGYYAEGLPPLGYKRTHPKGHKGIEKNILVVVPEEAETVRKIFRLYVGGLSMQRVARALGLKLDRVKDALDRRLYTGEIQNSQGEWIKGKHEALIDAATFARARALIAERRKGGPRPRDGKSETSDWILRDVARCKCGAKAGAAYAGPKDKRRYYYTCSKRCQSLGNRATNGSYVPVREVESAFEPLVFARLEELRTELTKATPPPKKPKASDAGERKAKLERKRSRLLEAFADGHMTREELRDRMAKLDEERMRLAADEEPPAPLPKRALLSAWGDIERAWRRAPSVGKGAIRRALVNRLASEVVLTDKGPVPKWRSVKELAQQEAS